jgi:hypothetical protein
MIIFIILCKNQLFIIRIYRKFIDKFLRYETINENKTTISEEKLEKQMNKL